MMNDLTAGERPLVGNMIGSYNKKFAEKWEKNFHKAFGRDGA
jgi:hypothetical protein